MIAAAALLAGTVVPALAVIRNSMVQSRELHQRNLMANYAVQMMEDQAAYVARNWTSTTLAGDFSTDGHGGIRYTLTRSDAVSDGGIVGSLMNISITIYEDADGDDTLDATEIRESYRTKVAKLNTYENEL